MDPSCKIPTRRPVSIINIAVLVLFFILLGGCGGFPHLVILHDPLTSEEHVALGRSYEAQGKIDLAMEQYEAALEVQKDFIPALEAVGDLSASQSQFLEAERVYQRILRIDSNRPRVLNNLGWIYSVQGVKMEKAERLIQKAIQIDPDQKAYYLDTLGGLYIRMEKLKQAKEVLNEARAAAPPDPRLEASLEEKFNALEARENLWSLPAPFVIEENIRDDPK